VLSALVEASGSGDIDSAAGAPLRAPLLVVGADVLFAALCVRPVLRSLRWLLQWGAAAGGCDDRVGLIVDPGRFSRDDFEALAADEGLRVVIRVDVPDVPTPWTLMREATVMVVALADCGGGADGSGVCGGGTTARVGSLLHAVCAAVEAWRGRASTPGVDASAGALKHGYVMPPVG